MNSVKSKNSHRNRLLQLLVDQQSEQENIEAQSKPNIMDDELGFDDTDDYEQIMRSNFSMCTSTFANYGESGGGGTGGGGGGTNSPQDAKRKRVQSTSSDLDENDDMEVDENNNNNYYSNSNSRLKQETCNCAKSGGTGSSDVMNNELNAIRNELIKLNSSDYCCAAALAATKEVDLKSAQSQGMSSRTRTSNNMSSEETTRSNTPSAMATSSSGSPSSSSSSSTRSTSPATATHRQQRHSPGDLLAINFQIDLNTVTSVRSSLTSETNSNELMLFKPINNLLKYSLSNRLHLMRKDTLLFLIESNLRANIRSPFDLLAYERLKRSNRVEPERSARFDYNYASLRRLSRVIAQQFGAGALSAGGGGEDLRLFDPLNRRLLKHNAFLPSCISTFLMPFYFDIFKVTELSNFSEPQIQLMLALKRSFRAQIFLNYDALVSYLRENILWNCFVLFKYRQVRSSDASMGFFNFYLSFVHILVHLEQVINYLQLNRSQESNQLLKEHIRHAIELSNVLPYLLDTLILTGLFKHSHYMRFKKFVYLRYPPSIGGAQQQQLNSQNELEAAYYDRALRSIESRASTGAFPMKLKALCRLKVNQCLREFSPACVDKLNIPKSTKTYLLYDQEINQFFFSQQQQQQP